MNDYAVSVAAIAFLVLVVVGVSCAWLLRLAAMREERRKQELAAFAKRHGFELFSAPPSGYLAGGLFGQQQQQAEHAEELTAMYANYLPFGLGSHPCVASIVCGPVGPGVFYALDYSYRVSSSSSDTRHECGVAVMRVPFNFKSIDIRPASFTDSFCETLGVRHLQFESEEFNRKYHVTCSDEKLAFDVVNPGMIDLLLGLEERHWQLYANHLVVYREPYYYSVDELERVLADMTGFLDRIPPLCAARLGHPQLACTDAVGSGRGRSLPRSCRHPRLCSLHSHFLPRNSGAGGGRGHRGCRGGRPDRFRVLAGTPARPSASRARGEVLFC